MPTQTHPADQFLPPQKLLVLGLQHVLVMYAGAVAVPLIVGRALKLSPEEVAFLISADLFACGLATLVQSVGLPGIGIRLPVMMGVTFAAVSPMLAMAAAPDVGILGIFGAVISAGLFGMLVAPFMSRLLPLFPPVVTGTIILVIGISLMRVGIGWAGGGLPTTFKVVEGVRGAFPNPAFGQLTGLAIALIVLVVILALIRFGEGFLANVAVLIGIAAGTLAAAAATLAGLANLMSFDKIAAAAWFAPVEPFHFGTPKFFFVEIDPAGFATGAFYRFVYSQPLMIATLAMCIVMVVVMVESIGMFLALGDMTGREIDRKALTRGLLADGIGTMLGGIFNTFPYTSFSQNVGLVGVTGVRSRWVAATGGLIMLGLGLVPKMAALVEAVPQVVLGGAGMVMFGMVAATGVRILAAVDFRANRFNPLVVAIAVSFGMIPLVAPNFFQAFPESLKPLLDSGILLAAFAAVLLNAFFNGLAGARESAEAAAETARAADHA